MTRVLAVVVVLFSLAGPVAAADEGTFPTTREGIAAVIAGVIYSLIGLWNRRGTKTVENKTDAQTLLLERLVRDLDDMRSASQDEDRLTTMELAAHGDKLQELAAEQASMARAQEEQGLTLADHGRQIVVLADGVARLQTIVNQRQTDKALAGGLVAALTPTAPNGPSESKDD